MDGTSELGNHLHRGGDKPQGQEIPGEGAGKRESPEQNPVGGALWQRTGARWLGFEP